MDEVKDVSASEPMRLGERRQVSVLFADMVGYTATVERLGEENALHFTRMIYEMLTGAVGEHGGTVRSFAGDGIMAFFGIPTAQEDAALRACRAALSIQAAFAAAADSIEARFDVRPNMRVGVSSGAVVMATGGRRRFPDECRREYRESGLTHSGLGSSGRLSDMRRDATPRRICCRLEL